MVGYLCSMDGGAHPRIGGGGKGSFVVSCGGYPVLQAGNIGGQEAGSPLVLFLKIPHPL